MASSGIRNKATVRSRPKSVRSLVKDAFQLTIECGICTEIKELRQLPCQHMMCYDCLDRIISGARGQGLQPACSFCKAKLTGRAGDYPVCRLAANLRTELDQLEKALSTSPYQGGTADQSQLCESGECQRHIDRYCRSCELYSCYRCSEGSCKDHTKDLVEFVELEKASKDKYERWKVEKMTRIANANEKQKKLVTEFKEQVAKASDTDISGMLESVSTMKESIQAANKKVAEETRVYEQYESDISGVSDVEFVRLVEQLSIENSNPRTQKKYMSIKPVRGVRKETTFVVSLKTREDVISDLCSDANNTADGKILVGLSDGFSVYDSMGVLVKSVSIKNTAVICLLHYEKMIFTISNCDGTSRLEIYDEMSYVKIHDWPLIFPAYKLAISTDKVFVTDRGSKQLHRFGLFGELLEPFTHSTFQSPVYISSCSIDSILISDFSANKVHRMNTQTDQMMWTCTINGPDAICCADNGNVWIFSHHNKNLFVLSVSTGKLKQELTHPMFAEDGSSVFGIHVETTDPGLWIAGRHGLSKLSLRKNACQALYDCAAMKDDEVSFLKDDVIIDCSEDNSDWWIGTVIRTGSNGLFPSDYVIKLLHSWEDGKE